jgi:class 3 adenylate cyclase
MDGCFELLSRAVHRYEGTINQFTGDGIMALFRGQSFSQNRGTSGPEARCAR